METIPKSWKSYAILRIRWALRVSRAVLFSCVVLGSLAANYNPLCSQVLMHGTAPAGTVNLIGNDAAILDSGETKKDLPCTVTPVKPLLGFDLRFHSGYDIRIPLRELAGDGDILTIIFRVTSDTA